MFELLLLGLFSGLGGSIAFFTEVIKRTKIPTDTTNQKQLVAFVISFLVVTGLGYYSKASIVETAGLIPLAWGFSIGFYEVILKRIVERFF